GHQAQFAAGNRTLEVPGHPPAESRPGDAAGDARGRLDGAAGPAMVLDDDGADGHRVAAAAAARTAARGTAIIAVVSGLLAQSSRRCRARSRTDSARRDAARVPRAEDDSR